MKSISTLVLATLLAGGAMGVAADPAVAQGKKDKKEQPAKATYSPAFLKVAQPAQAALKVDAAAPAAEAAVVAAEAAASTEDDKYQVGLMRLQISQAKLRANPTGDPQALRAPLEALLANSKATPEQRASFAAVLGRLAYQRKDYAGAIASFTQAQQAGSTDAELPNLLRQARLLSGDTAGAAASYEASIAAAEAKGEKAAELDYRVAVDAYQKSNQRPQAVAALRRWVAAYPTTKNWRDALYIYGLQRGSMVTLDRMQTLDVLRLLRQNRSLDRFAYQEYAQKVVDAGLPDEGKAVLAEGVGGGTVQRNPTVSALMAQADRQIELQGSLAPLEAKAQSAGNGNLAYQTGDAYLGQKNYAKAAALYRTALTKGGVDADAVNTHLGIALALSGDKAGARTAFETVKGGARADIAQFWIVWLDHPATA